MKKNALNASDFRAKGLSVIGLSGKLTIRLTD